MWWVVVDLAPSEAEGQSSGICPPSVIPAQHQRSRDFIHCPNLSEGEGDLTEPFLAHGLPRKPHCVPMTPWARDLGKLSI